MKRLKLNKKSNFLSSLILRNNYKDNLKENIKLIIKAFSIIFTICSIILFLGVLFSIFPGYTLASLAPFLIAKGVVLTTNYAIVYMLFLLMSIPLAKINQKYNNKKVHNILKENNIKVRDEELDKAEVYSITKENKLSKDKRNKVVSVAKISTKDKLYYLKQITKSYMNELYLIDKDEYNKELKKYNEEKVKSKLLKLEK